MRIAVAAVVGVVVLLSSVPTVGAAAAPRQRNETCIDKCNFGFEKCLTREGAKPTGRCDVNVVRCKNACPYEEDEVPALPTAKSHQRCVDACRVTYKKCENLADSNRQGGNCAADDMRCEKACPKPEPEVVTAPPPAPPVETGAAPVTAPAAPAVSVPKVESPPRRAARVEGAAVSAPAVATPAASVGERAGASAPTVRSEGVTPPATAPTEASAAAVHPAPRERGFFGKLGCFFHACEAPAATPCLKECGIVYDVCRTRESKRGGECNTRLMRCRQDCRDAAPAAP